MPRPRRALALACALVSLIAGVPAALAQETVQYDQVAVGSDAAAVCGFCATEKFGTIFYDLNGTGLTASQFPLRIDEIQVAVGSTRVTGDLTGFTCQGSSTGGTVDAELAIYAGTVVPSNITQLPAGQWPGELTIVAPNLVPLQLSVDTNPPTNQWSLMFNSITVGQTVRPGSRYVRVVITIPRGSPGASAACELLTLQPPAFSPFRDDNGRVGPQRGFIYQLGILSTPAQWTWLEDVQDPFGGTVGINGDWLLRMRYTPLSPGSTDAGVALDAAPAADAEVTDAGPRPDAAVDRDASIATDASSGPIDASAPDAASTAPPPVINAVSPDEGRTDVATNVTVIGANFAPGLTVRIGAIQIEVTALNGASTIDAVVPPGIASGRYDVLVRNPDGQSAVLTEGFTVLDEDGNPPPTESGCRCGGRPISAGAWGWLALLGGLGLLRRRFGRPPGPSAFRC